MKKKSLSILSITCILYVHEILIPRSALCAENFSLLSSSLKMIWGLLIVLGILLIIYGLVKKRVNLLQGGGKGIINVVESRHLMPKKSLFLVEVRGKEYLLGSGADSLNLIAALDDVNQSQSHFETILKETETINPA